MAKPQSSLSRMIMSFPTLLQWYPSQHRGLQLFPTFPGARAAYQLLHLGTTGNLRAANLICFGMPQRVRPFNEIMNDEARTIALGTFSLRESGMPRGCRACAWQAARFGLYRPSLRKVLARRMKK